MNTNRFHRPTGHEKNLFEKNFFLSPLNFTAFLAGVYTRTPKNLIRHPISHALEITLIKKQGFDWSAGMPVKSGMKNVFRECPAQHAGREICPPIGWGMTLVQTEATKLTGIAKNKGVLILPENEGVVFAGLVVFRFEE